MTGAQGAQATAPVPAAAAAAAASAYNGYKKSAESIHAKQVSIALWQ